MSCTISLQVHGNTKSAVWLCMMCLVTVKAVTNGCYYKVVLCDSDVPPKASPTL